MNPPVSSSSSDASASIRWAAYAILIALSTSHMAGRILAVNSIDKIALENSLVQREVAKRKSQLQANNEPVDEAFLTQQSLEKVRQQRPFLSANDRSRWCTVRSLVELGTYEIDDIQSQPGWDTIDMVQHTGADGRKHLYSSKPPLLATLMAGEYWLIHKLTGVTLGTHPYEIGRFMLLTLNVVPLVVYFLILARLAERWGTSDWGRLLMMGAATFGTFLTLFAVTINNHLHGAVCAAIVISAAIAIWYDGHRQLWLFGVAGFFGALLVACELPALSLFVAITVPLLWKAPKQTLIAYLPAAFVIAAASVGTNYLAHGTWRPAYAFRSDTNPEENWYKFKYERDGKVRDSYWSNPKGLDAGEKSPAAYAMHALVGHHGVFSLTPVWLLSLVGLGMAIFDRRRRDLAVVVAAVSLACMAFYLFPPKEIDRNYGGMTSGFRWTFWLTPLWLLTMLPAADWLCRGKWGRGLALVLLALSTLSVAYPWQPWRLPWIADFFVYLGWAKW